MVTLPWSKKESFVFFQIRHPIFWSLQATSTSLPHVVGTLERASSICRIERCFCTPKNGTYSLLVGRVYTERDASPPASSVMARLQKGNLQNAIPPSPPPLLSRLALQIRFSCILKEAIEAHKLTDLANCILFAYSENGFLVFRI